MAFCLNDAVFHEKKYSAVVSLSDPALENIDHEEIFTAIQAGEG